MKVKIHSLIIMKSFLLVIFDIFLILVNGQSLEVTPDPAMGVLEGSVKIKWTVRKADQTDAIASTRLYLGTNFTQNKLLYRGVNSLVKQSLADEMFGEQIQVTFKEPIYTLTLRKLNITDTVKFTLVMNPEMSATLKVRPILKKSVEVIVVKGMNFFCFFVIFLNFHESLTVFFFFFFFF